MTLCSGSFEWWQALEHVLRGQNMVCWYWNLVDAKDWTRVYVKAWFLWMVKVISEMWSYGGRLGMLTVPTYSMKHAGMEIWGFRCKFWELISLVHKSLCHEVWNDAFEKEMAWLLFYGLDEFKWSFWKCLNDCLGLRFYGVWIPKFKVWGIRKDKVTWDAAGYLWGWCWF